MHSLPECKTRHFASWAAFLGISSVLNWFNMTYTHIFGYIYIYTHTYIYIYTPVHMSHVFKKSEWCMSRYLQVSMIHSFLTSVVSVKLFPTSPASQETRAAAAEGGLRTSGPWGGAQARDRAGEGREARAGWRPSEGRRPGEVPTSKRSVEAGGTVKNMWRICCIFGGQVWIHMGKVYGEVTEVMIYDLCARFVRQDARCLRLTDVAAVDVRSLRTSKPERMRWKRRRWVFFKTSGYPAWWTNS